MSYVVVVVMRTARSHNHMDIFDCVERDKAFAYLDVFYMFYFLERIVCAHAHAQGVNVIARCFSSSLGSLGIEETTTYFT